MEYDQTRARRTARNKGDCSRDHLKKERWNGTQQLLQFNSVSIGHPWNTAGAQRTWVPFPDPSVYYCWDVRDEISLIYQPFFPGQQMYDPKEMTKAHTEWVKFLSSCLSFPHFLPSISFSWLSGTAGSKSHILRYSYHLSERCTFEGQVTFQTQDRLVSSDLKINE